MIPSTLHVASCQCLLLNNVDMILIAVNACPGIIKNVGRVLVGLRGVTRCQHQLFLRSSCYSCGYPFALCLIEICQKVADIFMGDTSCSSTFDGPQISVSSVGLFIVVMYGLKMRRNYQVT